MRSALKKLGDREVGETTFDCPFKPVEKEFVHVTCNFFFFFFYALLILGVQIYLTFCARLELENMSTNKT